MSDTLDLLTLAEGKRAVGVPANTTSKDTQLALYITGVSRAMDDTFGPSVVRTTTGELHDGVMGGYAGGGGQAEAVAAVAADRERLGALQRGHFGVVLAQHQARFQI